MIDFANAPITESRKPPTWPSDQACLPSIKFVNGSEVVFGKPWWLPVIHELKVHEAIIADLGA